METVVGCDGSDGARAALEGAISTAEGLGDRPVLVFGYEPPGRTVGEEFGEHRRALEEYGTAITHGCAERVRAAGVEAETALVARSPAVALDDVARERGARMIVVGTHGESPLRGVILGSTPHKLLHISETPVLCVRG